MKIKTPIATKLVLRLATFSFLCAGLGAADRIAFAGETTSSLTWSIVPTPRKVGTFSQLYGVSVLSPTQAWAVGQRSANEAAPLIYRWDGTRWKEVAAAPIADSYFQDVFAISSSDVWAVGFQDRDDISPDLSLTQHWNGTAWSIVPSPNPSKDPFYGENYLAAVAGAAANDVWAVGDQQTSRGYSELIIHWDGSAWTLVPPLPGDWRLLTDIATLSASDVWAVGYQFNFHDGYQGLTMHWDGSKWSDVAFPIADDGFYVHGMTALSDSDIWVVGDTSGYPITPVTAHWNGNFWSLVNITNFEPPYGSLKAVAILADNDVWAVGYYRDTLGGKDENLVEHWDGVAWSQVVVPNVSRSLNQLYDVAPDQAGGLWMVGYFYPYPDFSKPVSTLVIRGTP